ncbi:MAG TPA: hypothetical protein VL728_12880 [Cyclobacteriaceae bacterium]|jgi:hypothetical protein|nr:hypothetical protein [Cyclobacteriaceae bacterium]
MKTQYKANRITGVVLFSTLMFAVIYQVSAQNLHLFRPQSATYLGGSVSVGFPQYSLKSNIAAIDQQKVACTGATVGGMVSNAIGKIKADLGLFYSNASSGNDMQMTQGSVSGNLYVLRLKRAAPYHTFEPYVKFGLASQLTKFYGNYLNANENTTETNYSSDTQPLLNTSWLHQGQLGLGIEYQFENNSDRFVQLFGEISYGLPISMKSSNPVFAKTSLVDQTTISFGVSFGIIK